MPRGYTDRTPLKRANFIKALRESASVTKACEMAAIGRVTAYQWRNADPAFAEEWEQTLNAAIEDLEVEARRRAIQGIEKGVWHQGQLVGTEIQYSDTMLIFLLKGNKPEKYRDNARIEHTGANGGPIEYVDRETKLKRYRETFLAEGEPVPPDEVLWADIEKYEAETIQAPGVQ